MEIKLLNEPFPFAGSGVPRSPGPHLTPIIKGLQELLYGSKSVDWDLELCADIGFTWERAMEMALKDRLGIRPGELKRDGIICSPDYLAPDPEGEFPLVVVETKHWWRSSNKPVEDDWYAMMQLKCYCKLAGTRCAVMRICYCVGAYWGQGPVYKVLRIVFDQDEIDDAWGMIVRNKEMGNE